jgi:hypothetical protein
MSFKGILYAGYILPNFFSCSSCDPMFLISTLENSNLCTSSLMNQDIGFFFSDDSKFWILPGAFSLAVKIYHSRRFFSSISNQQSFCNNCKNRCIFMKILTCRIFLILIFLCAMVLSETTSPKMTFIVLSNVIHRLNNILHIMDCNFFI